MAAVSAVVNVDKSFLLRAAVDADCCSAEPVGRRVNASEMPPPIMAIISSRPKSELLLFLLIIISKAYKRDTVFTVIKGEDSLGFGRRSRTRQYSKYITVSWWKRSTFEVGGIGAVLVLNRESSLAKSW